MDESGCPHVAGVLKNVTHKKPAERGGLLDGRGGLGPFLRRAGYKHRPIGQIALHRIFGNSTFSKKVLDTFGDDVLSVSHYLATVRCPGNRTRRWILFAAIVATLRVQSPCSNLMAQCRDQNADGVIRHSESGYSCPEVVRSCMARVFHRVPCPEWWGRCMAEMPSRGRTKLTALRERLAKGVSLRNHEIRLKPLRNTQHSGRLAVSSNARIILRSWPAGWTRL